MLAHEWNTKQSAIGSSQDELVHAVTRGDKLQAKGTSDNQQLQLFKDQVQLLQNEVNKASQGVNQVQDKTYVCTLEDRNVS
jgi:predicted  nucleic acid-binding Zn-ribbon protein